MKTIKSHFLKLKGTLESLEAIKDDVKKDIRKTLIGRNVVHKETKRVGIIDSVNFYSDGMTPCVYVRYNNNVAAIITDIEEIEFD